MLHDTLASARCMIAIYLIAREQFEPADHSMLLNC
jgi:hypothetical protein